MDLLQRFEKTITDHGMLRDGDRVLVGVSGGPDSMTLLHLLLRCSLDLVLEVFHLDHGLRAESMMEAEKVANLAESLGLPCHCYREDIEAIRRQRGGSVQEVAREVRLKKLRRVAEARKLDIIALGQQADDQVETLLLNLLRGSGLTGLGGIPYKSCYGIIHPLLDIWRQEIEAYCRFFSLDPVCDSSNLEAKYTRNRIRLELIPLLEDYNPNAKKKLWQTARLAQEDDNYLQCTAQRELAAIREEGNHFLPRTIVKVGLDNLKGLPGPLLKRLLFALLKEAEPEKSFYYDHMELVLSLLEEGKTGECLILPGPLQLEKGYKYLYLIPEERREKILPFKYRLAIPGTVEIPEKDLIFTAKVRRHDIDYKKEAGRQKEFIAGDSGFDHLILRNRCPGDRFFPLGAPGERKLKDFFIDANIDKILRDEIPLLQTPRGEIVWVSGLRISHKFRVKPTTKKIIELSYCKTSERVGKDE